MSLASVTFQVRQPDGAVEETDLSSVSLGTFVSAVPWRRFRPYRGQPHYSGSYWCATTSTPVGYESRLELGNLILEDFDSNTSWILSQPFLIVGTDGKRARRHVPDYLVELVGGGLRIIDVKPAALLEQPEVRESLAWSRKVIEAAGWDYHVVSEPDACLLTNVRFLSGYRRAFQFLPIETEAVRLAIDQPMTIRAAVARAGDVVADPDHARAIVFHLLWNGRLVADLSRSLQGDSIVAVGS